MATKLDSLTEHGINYRLDLHGPRQPHQPPRRPPLYSRATPSPISTLPASINPRESFWRHLEMKASRYARCWCGDGLWARKSQAMNA